MPTTELHLMQQQVRATRGDLQAGGSPASWPTSRASWPWLGGFLDVTSELEAKAAEGLGYDGLVGGSGGRGGFSGKANAFLNPGSHSRPDSGEFANRASLVVVGHGGEGAFAEDGGATSSKEAFPCFGVGFDSCTVEDVGFLGSCPQSEALACS